MDFDADFVVGELLELVAGSGGLEKGDADGNCRHENEDVSVDVVIINVPNNEAVCLLRERELAP